MINSDSKGDQFVYDENFNYITNRPKEPVRYITEYNVYEGIGINTKNINGKLNKQIAKLVDGLKKQAVADKFENYDESNYSELLDDFSNEIKTLLENNLADFGNGQAYTEKVEVEDDGFWINKDAKYDYRAISITVSADPIIEPDDCIEG